MMSMGALAQEPVGGVPNAPHDPEAEARAAAYNVALEAKLAATSIFDFSIAYLVKDSVIAPDAAESERTLASVLGAQSFSTWDEFIAQNEQTPFQIILIHNSFYDQVDVEFTRHAYRHQVIIAGIGMAFEQMVEITGDKCQRNPNPHLKPEQTHNWMMYFTYSVTLEEERYRPIVTEATLETCRENFDTGETMVDVLHGVSHSPIINPLGDMRNFTNRLRFVGTIHYNLIGNKVVKQP
jgi:hypothetical protein